MTALAQKNRIKASAVPPDLHEGWQRTTIGAVCSKPQYGWTTSAANSGTVKLLRTTDITHGPVDWCSVPYCQEAPGDVEKYLLADGDIVVSRAGSVGFSCRVVAPERAVFASYLIRFRPKPKIIEGKYLEYVLQSPAYWAQVRGSTAGIALPNVNASKLEAFEIPLPPLPEQRRIVAEIEQQFTRLDAAVAALRRTQANLKRYRTAVLKAACEGRLVPTEAELARTGGHSFEAGDQLLTRILKERHKNWNGRGKYKEPTAPETNGLPTLPDGWTWAILEAVTDAVGGFAFQSAKFSDTGFQVVKMANIRMGKIDLTQRPSFISDVTEDIIEKYSLRNGDIIVTLTGTRKKRDYGYVAVVKNEEKLLLNQRIARVRPSPGIEPKFLQLAMQAERYRDRFFSHETGNVGQGNVGIAAVTTEMITLPPFAEQTRIVAEVERRLSVVDELESVVKANLQRATRLRQSILKIALRG